MTENTNSYLTSNTSVNNGNNTIEYGYNTYNGLIDQYKDPSTNTVLWKLNTANEKMQVLTASLGNGMQITNKYDSYGYYETAKHSSSTATALNLEYQFQAVRGLLNYRKNNITGVLSWNESFTYDNQDRLLSWTDPTGTTSNTYETDGRIKTNDLVGAYNYDAGNRYRKKSATLNATGLAFYTNRSLQEVSYDMFKNPITITEKNRGKVDFEYNLSNSRSKSIVTTEAGIVAKTKYYSGITAVEVIERPNQSLQFITYIAGSPYDAAVALEKTYTNTGGNYTPSTQEYLYLHRDYQGTVLAISGNGGTIKERRQFDAWGLLKKYYKNNVEVAATSFNDVDFELLTDRGYTAHEHFFSVGIIHMNARLYDPILHTFLSADALIADPSNPQNYNRYAYALNNPLMYVDYDGNEPITAAVVITAAVIGAVIGGVSYVAINLYNGTAITWGGLTKSILVGAVSGAATCGIGSIAGSIFSNTATGFFQGALQGAVTGAITGTGGAFINAILNGDNPTLKAILQGALTGAVVGGIIGGIQGGIKADKAGLDFWDGTGTSDSPVGNITNSDSSGRVEYSSKSAKSFSDSHSELKRLSANVDELHANGTVPKGYKVINNRIFRTSDNVEVNGITVRGKKDWFGFTKTNKVYLSQTAFTSRNQLYTVLHHEYMHAYFYSNGIHFSGVNEHRIINQWEYDQAKAWNWVGEYDPKLRFGMQGIHYSDYGFKIIKKLP